MTRFVFKEMFGIGSSIKPDTANSVRWSDKDLDELADSMLTPDNLDSATPAGYTYLGQFIAHDISLDSKNDRRKLHDRPWGRIKPQEITNLRCPFFDLETIYGSDDPKNKEETPRRALMEKDSKSLLKLGNTIAEGQSSSNEQLLKAFPNDLPRDRNGSEAIIVDPRNDENLVVSQLQVAFIKFHNAVVSMLGKPDSDDLFEQARRIVIRHYQHIILTDFLPKIVDEKILKRVRAEVESGSCTFDILNSDDIFMPLEFAFAAFRMGHSTIRNSYNWNRHLSNAVFLGKLALLTGRGNMAGKQTHLPTIWLINWNWFFDINGSKTRENEKFNFAKKFDTRISSLLGSFHPLIEKDVWNGPLLEKTNQKIFIRLNSLPALDLFRGRALGLPTGQEIARIFEKSANLETLQSENIEEFLPENLKKVFRDETPLWFYLLAEAESQNEGETLGNIGSWIVAETFLKLLNASPDSILDSKQGRLPLLMKNQETGKYEFSDEKKCFSMSEMLQFIKDRNTKDFDELDPIGENSVNTALAFNKPIDQKK